MTEKVTLDEVNDWLDRKSCFSCESTNLVKELKNGYHILRCKECNIINASIRTTKEKSNK